MEMNREVVCNAPCNGQRSPVTRILPIKYGSSVAPRAAMSAEGCGQAAPSRHAAHGPGVDRVCAAPRRSACSVTLRRRRQSAGPWQGWRDLHGAVDRKTTQNQPLNALGPDRVGRSELDGGAKSARFPTVSASDRLINDLPGRREPNRNSAMALHRLVAQLGAAPAAPGAAASTPPPSFRALQAEGCPPSPARRPRVCLSPAPEVIGSGRKAGPKNREGLGEGAGVGRSTLSATN